MKTEELQTVGKSFLFGGIGEEDRKSLLSCLSAEKKKFKKGEYVVRAGDPVRAVGIILSGRADVIKENFWGNRDIVTAVMPGETFAESYACMPETVSGVSVQAAEDTEVLFMNIRKILRTCSSACMFHTRLIQNLISLLAKKNILLNEKMTHVTQRSTREKLLSYLSSESVKRHSAYFDIPYDRQQLADYLSVDRSAMSAELSKMKKEKILDYEKNSFSLKQKNIL